MRLFLQHGIYEGRKIIGKSDDALAHETTKPMVSIVIINFNNAHLLPKALGSVMGQTLKDIEIIVVDDCSTDRSREIISDYASKDSRIKLIANTKNSLTLITRNRGVEAATGRYLMLLDSDDYIAPTACEIAANEIAKGYDMVKFGAHIINSLGAPEEEIRNCDEWCNRGEAREYYNEEILTSIFRECKMSWTVWTYISRLDLAKRALAELPDEYITGTDDLYTLLAIVRRATSLLKINDRLYYYNYGPGLSVTVDKDKLFKYAPPRAKAIRAIEKFAYKYSLNVDIEILYQNLCDDLLAKFLAISEKHDVSDMFNQLTQILGFKAAIQGLYRRHSHAVDKLANLIRPLEYSAPIKRIGIFAPKLHYGGMETAILTLCVILKRQNYELTLLLEEKSRRDTKYAGFARLIYIGPFSKEHSVFSNRFMNLTDALDTHIDAMLYFQPQNDAFLWDLLTFHHFNVSVIPWLSDSFIASVSGANAQGRALSEKLFRNTDAVICQSDAEELYLRTRGVNAVAMHAPIIQKAYMPRTEMPARIGLVGRLGLARKQTIESLKVLREVAKRIPWVSLCLIGDFNSVEQGNKFRQKAREFGLGKNITITGWTENPELFLKECGALLSVSASESMALGISEAQSLGLPCVIYDIPIDQSRDNPSIIAVPQGDYEAAGTALLSLMENNEKWQKLSQIAVEHSRKYAPELFIEKIRLFLHNFQSISPITRYAARDYTDVINYMSYYSGRNLGAVIHI